MTEKKNPWMKWYPADWRSEPRLRLCSLAARGLWADIISYCHDAEPYGHFVIEGQPPDEPGIAALVGRPAKEVRAALAELDRFKVFARTDEGVIYSRRMVRDKAKADTDRENGKGGGNPKLSKADKGGVNPPDKGGDKAQKLEPRTQIKAAAVAPEPFADVIAAFDRARVEAFGASQARPWPGQHDAIAARRWLGAGAAPDLIEDIFRAKMKSMAAKGQRPPGSLKFFEQIIADALAASAQPMPEGTAHAKPTRADPATAERDRRAAIMAAIGPEMAGEMGAGHPDDRGAETHSGGTGDGFDVDSEAGNVPDKRHQSVRGGDGSADSIRADVRPAGSGSEIVGRVLQSGPKRPSARPDDGSDRHDDQDAQIPRSAEAGGDQEARRGQADPPPPLAAPGATRSDEEVKADLCAIPAFLRRMA